MGHWRQEMRNLQPPHHARRVVTIRRPGVPPALVWVAVILSFAAGALFSALWQMAST